MILMVLEGMCLMKISQNYNYKWYLKNETR